jgi:hypothetical protein
MDEAAQEMYLRSQVNKDSHASIVGDEEVGRGLSADEESAFFLVSGIFGPGQQ